jgi:hypothetical protein
MAAPPNAAHVKKALANSEASTHIGGLLLVVTTTSLKRPYSPSKIGAGLLSPPRTSLAATACRFGIGAPGSLRPWAKPTP